MYSHVIDALAKSPHLYHIVLSDILLRQFIILYINRMDCKGTAAAAAAAADVNLNNDDDDDAVSQQVMLSNEQLRPIITTLQCPSGLLWNDKDRHHYPNMIRFTGVIRGYAQSSRPMDAERLLQLMISLSSTSSTLEPSPSTSSSFLSMFRPNDVSYATVIDAYSRILMRGLSQ
jgi:pentatricopeptide repeat protein